MARIVGWHLQPREDEPCKCGKPSTVIVMDDDTDCYESACNTCVPEGTADPVGEVFARLFEEKDAEA